MKKIGNILLLLGIVGHFWGAAQWTLHIVIFDSVLAIVYQSMADVLVWSGLLLLLNSKQ